MLYAMVCQQVKSEKTPNNQELHSINYTRIAKDKFKIYQHIKLLPSKNDYNTTDLSYNNKYKNNPYFNA